jgi:hypothetical protein
VLSKLLLSVYAGLNVQNLGFEYSSVCGIECPESSEFNTLLSELNALVSFHGRREVSERKKEK